MMPGGGYGENAGLASATGGEGFTSLYSVPFGNSMRMSIFLLAFEIGTTRQAYTCAPVGSSAKVTALLKLRAGIDRLYTWLGPDYLKRRDTTHERMRTLIDRGEYEDLIKLEQELLAYLYEDVKLFKYMNVKDIDRRRVELENKEHGL